MKCPACGESLKGIAPCSEEEWLCVNEDCPIQGRELYGSTQKDVNACAVIFMNRIKQTKRT